MAGITLERATAQLEFYLTAEQKVLTGQRVRIGDKDITRADLDMIQAGINTWEQRVNRLSAAASSGGCRLVRRVAVLS